MRWIESLLEHPAVYSAWQAPFVSQKFAPAEWHLQQRQIRRVLDVGCGPGTNALRFAGADYVGIDINERYLAVARTRSQGRFVRADLQTDDVSMLGLFDTILVNSVLHHLPDAAVTRTLSQLQRLLEPEGRVHILELVLPQVNSLARIMAKLDRGRYARPLERWRELFDPHFEAVCVEPYHFGGGLWAMVYFQGKARECVSP
jgi:SAM-dependent methyltransferase